MPDEIFIYTITFLDIYSCELLGRTCKKMLKYCHETYVDKDFDFYLEICNYLLTKKMKYYIYGGFIRSVIGKIRPNDMDIYVERKIYYKYTILHL